MDSQSNNPYYTAPQNSELLLRGIGSALQGIGASGSRTLHGQILRAGAGLAGGVGSAYGDAMHQQRVDPLLRQLAINQAAAQAAQGIGVPVTAAQNVPVEGPLMESGAFGSSGAERPMGTIPAITRPPISQYELLANAPNDKARAALLLGGNLERFVNNPMPAAQLEHVQLQNKMIPVQMAKLEAEAAALGSGAADATNLPNRISAELNRDPTTGKINYAGAAETLKQLRTNPQGPEGRIFDYYAEKERTGKEDPAMERAIKGYQTTLQGLRQAAGYGTGSGTEAGRVEVRSTPAARGAAENVAAGAATGKEKATIDVKQDAPLDLNANKWVDPKTLQYAPADYSVQKAKDAGYVAVSTTLSAAIPSARSALQTLDKYDDLSRKLLVPKGKGTAADIVRIQANRARLQALRSAGDPTVVDFDAMAATLPTQVKAFGDTGNIAVKEQEFQAKALPNTQDSLESALEKTKTRRTLLQNIIRGSLGTPSSSSRQLPGPMIAPAGIPKVLSIEKIQ